MKRIAVLLAFVAGLATAVCAEETAWIKDISVGFDKLSGNTDRSEFNLTAGISKGFTHSDFSEKFDLFYSSANDDMDGQKWTSITRYALNFGKDDRWFHPYQLSLHHDRFADIDIRYMPNIGIGYWISKSDDFKWSVEGAFGYQVTEYRSSTPTKKTTTLPLRTFLDKKVFDNSHLTEELIFTPSLEGEGNLLHSESAFTNPITKGLDLTLRYIVDHDSQPAFNKEKTDTRIVAGLKYTF